MDYLIGFLFGYFLPKFFRYLDKLGKDLIEIPDHYSEEDWDWIR
tara:strand:- start:355 stop:486 length:132 start_codon:yes stop_codon:yes gene_type:complete